MKKFVFLLAALPAGLVAFWFFWNLSHGPSVDLILPSRTDSIGEFITAYYGDVILFGLVGLAAVLCIANFMLLDRQDTLNLRRVPFRAMSLAESLAGAACLVTPFRFFSTWDGYTHYRWGVPVLFLAIVGIILMLAAREDWLATHTIRRLRRGARTALRPFHRLAN